MALNHPFWAEARDLIQKGKLKQAEPLLKSLQNKFPAQQEFRYAQAFITQHLGNTAVAAQLYGDLVNEQTSPADWHVNYGVTLLKEGRATEAEYQFAISLRKNPQFPDPWLLNYAMALSLSGKVEDAGQAFRILLARSPSWPDGWLQYASHLTRNDRFEDCIPAWQQYWQLKPRDHHPPINIGAALFSLRRHADAEAVLRKGLQITPDEIHMLVNLACVVMAQARLDEALALFDRALELAPDNIDVIGAAVGLMHALESPKQAEALLERGINHPKNQHEFKFLLASVKLALAKFDEGWDLYRYRWQSRLFKDKRPAYDVPEWRGESLEGKGLLIMIEQGMADQIQNLAFIPELLKTGAKLAMELDIRLMDMATRSFPDVLFFPIQSERILPSNFPIDYFVAQGDLGGFFRHSLADFAAHPTAYLQPEVEQINHWRQVLTADTPKKLRVGISWRSVRAKDSRSGLVYPPIDMWAKLIQSHPEIDWVNLQYDHPAADLEALQELSGVAIRGIEGLDLDKDQEGTAALIKSLDLVIGVANVPVFLASGVGTPSWSTWTGQLRIYWKTHGEEYLPWAKNIRLFKRKADQPWDEIFANISGELAAIK